MLVARCSSQLSGHQNDQRNQKVTTSERSDSQIYRIQGLYGAESKDPGNASWQMLFGAFRPQTTTEDKKSQTPSMMPGRRRQSAAS
jgi:hypothetical protein